MKKRIVTIEVSDVISAGSVRSALAAYCAESEEIDGGVVGPEFSTSGPGSGWSRNHDVTDFAERALSDDYGALGYLDLDDGRLATRDADTDEIAWTDASVVRLVAPTIDYQDRRHANAAWVAAVREMAREAAETHAAESDVVAWQRIVAWLDEDSAADQTAESSAPAGDLHDYQTGEYVRPATADERAKSLAAAESDGGVGAFRGDDGRTYYVAD